MRIIVDKLYRCSHCSHVFFEEEIFILYLSKDKLCESCYEAYGEFLEMNQEPYYKNSKRYRSF